MYQNSLVPIRCFLEQLQALGIDSLYLSDDAQRILTPPGKKAQLDALENSLQGCTRCRLCEKRNKMVFGAGNPEAELVFVGEGPGGDEDRQGIPFVGAAGKLLTDMIEKGMKISRKDVYICNVVKCRPPGNRNPELDEIATCEPFLIQQLEIIRPKVIIALGKFAAQTLLRVTTPISRMRGEWREYHGIKLMPTFHPSYILHIGNPERQRDEKMKIWEDLKKVMKELNLPF
ncbi:MAG: uracil-DNA glycosylase [Candidatus Omnitrophica bacterium]|nr:uracil-DNA glycosylase [Candidatus Omnitrophota bacterium]